MSAPGFRFEVRFVDVERRVYSRVDDHPQYAVACLAADAWVRATGADFVVWDRDERRALYDSRKMRAKFQSPAVIAPTSSGIGGDELELAGGGDDSRGPGHGSSGAGIAGSVSASRNARTASSSASESPSASSE